MRCGCIWGGFGFDLVNRFLHFRRSSVILLALDGLLAGVGGLDMVLGGDGCVVVVVVFVVVPSSFSPCPVVSTAVKAELVCTVVVVVVMALTIGLVVDALAVVFVEGVVAVVVVFAGIVVVFAVATCLPG